MLLDISSMKKALDSLEKAVARSKNEPADEELRDAVIQRFEYTYELSWKMLKRVLELESPNPAGIDQLSFPDMIREAGERGIIPNVEAWLVYREQRNITSHTYDKEKAESVYKTAIDFFRDALNLYCELEKRIRD